MGEPQFELLFLELHLQVVTQFLLGNFCIFDSTEIFIKKITLCSVCFHYRPRGACSKHRDGSAGLVLPTELCQRQHHPTFSLHNQTVQSQWSAALTLPLPQPQN